MVRADSLNVQGRRSVRIKWLRSSKLLSLMKWRPSVTPRLRNPGEAYSPEPGDVNLVPPTSQKYWGEPRQIALLQAKGVALTSRLTYAHSAKSASSGVLVALALRAVLDFPRLLTSLFLRSAFREQVTFGIHRR
jgi:hypothetical protein